MIRRRQTSYEAEDGRCSLKEIIIKISVEQKVPDLLAFTYNVRCKYQTKPDHHLTLY